MESERTAELAEQHTEDTLKNVVEDSWLDTHPSLYNRVAALAALPAVEAEDAPRAASLLDDMRSVEDKIVGMYIREDAIGEMTEIEWDDVAATIIIPVWTTLRERNRELLDRWTVDQLPEVLLQGPAVMARLVDFDGNAVPLQHQADMMLAVVRACLALALREAGWSFFADPEHGMVFERGEQSVDLESLISGIATGQIAIEPGHLNSLSNDWTQVCEKTGLSGKLLGGGTAPTAPAGDSQ